MILATIVPAPRRALTTVERLRAAWDGLARTDDQLEIAIAVASGQAEAHCGRVFARETVTELLEVAAWGDVALARAPVVSVASVTVNGSLVEAAGYEASSSEAGILRLLDVASPLTAFGRGSLAAADASYQGGVFGGGSEFAYGYRSIRPARLEVTYVGGWVVPLPAGATVPTGWGTPDLPPAVEAAVQMAVAETVRRSARSADVTSERLGDYSIGYASGASRSSGLSEDAKEMLRPWVLRVSI